MTHVENDTIDQSEPTDDDVGAFVAHAPYRPGGYRDPGQGRLEGLRLGVKDLFDVRGLKTGAGSPAWLAQNEPARRDAPVVKALLGAGAILAGKTLTDELAWSLNGENAHYGTPRNVRAPGRIPGGSSAGSAAAVAAGLIDIGLGSDTGGSVRLPASYCGLWGLRPSHARLDADGAVPLAPSFDTVGWFASTAKVLRLVGRVLFASSDPLEVTRLVWATDLAACTAPPLQEALKKEAEAFASSLSLELVSGSLSAIRPSGSALESWRKVFQICQSAEAWETHGAWIEAQKPDLSPGIADRFAFARSLDEPTVHKARADRLRIAEHLRARVPAGTVFLVPGAIGPAPLVAQTGEAANAVRLRALEILSPAGLAGLPQLAIPAVQTPDGPVGLGAIGWHGGDEALLAMAERIG